MYFELERLIIRELEEADLKPIHEGINSAEFARTGSSAPLIPLQYERLKDIFFSKEKPRALPIFGICKKPSPADIGRAETDGTGPLPVRGMIRLGDDRFDFKNRVADLGIGLFHPEDRGKGYGTEVLRWAFEYAFNDLNLHKIKLECFTNNPAAQALYRKVGMTEEGRPRKTYYNAGVWYDSILFGILEEDWCAQRKTGL